LPYSSGIFEWSCKCAVNLDHPLRIAVYSSDVSYTSHTKAKFFQDVIDIRGFYTVTSRGLIEGYDCKWQILLVGVFYGISDEMAVGVNSSVGYLVTLIGGDERWEHWRYPVCKATGY
jgi:ABC-type protease/lipase transport system fused ATPase/permease subunit